MKKNRRIELLADILHAQAQPYMGPERRMDPMKPYVVIWTPYPNAIINKNRIADFWTENEMDEWIAKMLKKFPKAEFDTAIRSAA